MNGRAFDINDVEREEMIISMGNDWECMMDCAMVDQKRLGPGCPSWYLNLQRIRADERA